jgi:hypothetical protein
MQGTFTGDGKVPENFGNIRNFPLQSVKQDPKHDLRLTECFLM